MYSGYICFIIYILCKYFLLVYGFSFQSLTSLLKSRSFNFFLNLPFNYIFHVLRREGRDERQTGRAPICWLTPQLPIIAERRSGPKLEVEYTIQVFQGMARTLLFEPLLLPSRVYIGGQLVSGLVRNTT